MRNIDVKYNKKKIWEVIEQHLNNDYRDPVPRVLPAITNEIEEPIEFIPECKKEDSQKEVVSNTSMWDAMVGLGIINKIKGKSFRSFRNIQREFIFNLPEIPERQVRRLGMPAANYVVLELMEDGYDFAATLLKGLMEKHDRMREPIPPEQIVNKSLKEMPQSVVFLGDILRQANIYFNENEVEKEFSLYYYTARHYETKDKRSWTWLADVFYKLAVKSVKHFNNDGGYAKSLINYMYGRYLLLKAKDAVHARKRLQTAYDISKGRPWGAMWATNISFEQISQYSSYLLHIAQLTAANKISNAQPAKAVEYSEEAVRHARRGNWHPDLEEAMMDLAISYTKNKQHDEAISTLVQLQGKINAKENRDMYISIQVLLALCYKRGRRKEEAIKQLFFLVELGREWNLPELVAFGHKYIARYLIEKDKIISARKYLVSCILHYKNLHHYKELIESVYLHGSCKASQHMKEYIELMMEAQSSDTPAFQKILDFLSNGKPFWKDKTLKRFIVKKNVRPLLENKPVLTASDKIYLLLRSRFGEQFADYAMEEITKYGEKPLACDHTNYFVDDPTELQYFKSKEEAEEYKAFLEDRYRGKNNRIEKLYGEHIYFDIIETEIEDESAEIEYINTLNTIDPIIPYPKDSPLYKQAINLIEDYLHPHNLTKPKTVYIDVSDPKILIRLLNTMVESGNVVFKFKGSIDFDGIIEEMARQRGEQQTFVETLPDVLEKRFSTEIPVKPKKISKTSFKTPSQDEMHSNLDYDSDEYIEKNRDILYNKNFAAIFD